MWNASGLGATDSVEQLDASGTRVVVDVGGSAMVWRRWGGGPLVVLVHGASGSWTHWVRNIRPLAQRFTVLAPDLPGFGESDLPDLDDSADGLAAQLVEAVDRLAGPVERLALVGFSFGGIVATLAAARLGTRVGRLVLIGAGGLGLTARVPEAPPAEPGPAEPGPKPEPEPESESESEDDRRDAAEHRSLARFMFGDPSRIDGAAVAINRENVRRARFRQRVDPGVHRTARRAPPGDGGDRRRLRRPGSVPAAPTPTSPSAGSGACGPT